MTCVALSINLETFRCLRTDLARRFAHRLDGHPGIASRIRQSTRSGRLLGCGPEPSYARTPVGPGWALVGDAALHQDPWSGLGIDMAGVHAGFLTDAIHDWISDAKDERTALREYHNRRNQHALSPFRQTVTLAADLRPMSRTPQPSTTSSEDGQPQYPHCDLDCATRSTQSFRMAVMSGNIFRIHGSKAEPRIRPPMPG